MNYGVLVPHYGKYCTAERLMSGAKRIEELGFDSLWVRDHLIWKPHGMEGTDQTFLDPFITLAAMAGVTKKIALGTAVLIPVRWPLKVAQNFSSLSFLSERLIHAGFGIGSNPQELAAAGFDVKNREAIFIETLEICHQVWDTGTVEFSRRAIYHRRRYARAEAAVGNHHVVWGFDAGCRPPIGSILSGLDSGPAAVHVVR